MIAIRANNNRVISGDSDIELNLSKFKKHQIVKN